MSWNGSGGNFSAKPQDRNVKRGLRHAYKAMIFVAILVCVVVVLVVSLRDRSYPAIDAVATKTPIRDFVPVAVSANDNVTTAVPSNEKKWPDKPPFGEKLWRHGEGPRSVAVTNGLLVTYPNYPGVKMILPDPINKPPFDNISDNEIASILSIKPGSTAIDVPLPRDFDKRFAESLLEKIEITDEDTPEQAEMKRQVIEARKVLADAVKRGESPREILIAERKNLQRLMRIRDNYQQIVHEQIQSGSSIQEINDIVKAANKILEKEGIEHPVILPMREAMALKEARATGEIED